MIFRQMNGMSYRRSVCWREDDEILFLILFKRMEIINSFPGALHSVSCRSLLLQDIVKLWQFPAVSLLSGDSHCDDVQLLDSIALALFDIPHLNSVCQDQTLCTATGLSFAHPHTTHSAVRCALYLPEYKRHTHTRMAIGVRIVEANDSVP